MIGDTETSLSCSWVLMLRMKIEAEIRCGGYCGVMGFVVERGRMDVMLKVRLLWAL